MPPSSSSSALSPQSPGPPTNVNVFRPRRSEDWHEYREIIEQLYRNDQLKLRDVRKIMEREYNFSATEKQYKDRLASWHVGKNLKTNQVRFMITKERKRAALGKKTVFRLNGQEVDPKKIARFARRKGLSGEQNKDKPPRKEGQESPEPSTPREIDYFTPEPAETPTPISDNQSPARESSVFALNYDPTHLESIPDIELGDQPYPIPLSNSQDQRQRQHQNQRQHQHQPHHQIQNQRIYHHSPDPLSLPHQVQPLSHLNHQHPPLHPHPHPHTYPHSHTQPNLHLQTHPHTHGHAHSQPLPFPHHQPPGITAIPIPPPHPGLMPNPDASPVVNTNAAGEIIPPDSWNRLDTFQTRLEGLQYTLNRTMSKWAREGDPNREVNHHEGLGM